MTITRPDRITQAMTALMEREVLPSALSSAEIGELSAELRRQTFFSARTTSAAYLAELQALTERFLAGGYNNDRAQLRIEARRLLVKYGYTPERGFPGDAALGVPAAAPGSLRDLSSERRLNLILETQRQLAAGLGQKLRGAARADTFPAWELVRLESREVPRGSDGESLGWQQRWSRAGMKPVYDETGRPRLMALKSDPGWLRLGSRQLFDDALDTDHPPFAFRSGFGWEEVDAETWSTFSSQFSVLSSQSPSTARPEINLPPSMERMPRGVKESIFAALDAVPEGELLSLEQLRALKRKALGQ